MSDITVNNNKEEFSKFERFVSLSNGEFWLCKEDVADRKVFAGQLLMIAQIDYIDDSAHTIHVRLHPSVVTTWDKESKFLIEDFLSKFDYVEKDKSEEIRKKEIENIQNRMNESQQELQDACVNAKLMDHLIEQEMPKPQSGKAALPVKYEAMNADVVGAIKSQIITSLMEQGLTATGIEQIKSGMEEQKNIAVRRGEWITIRTAKLTQIASELTPYFEEKAAVALALTKDMSNHVDTLMKGIGNLNLYVLKDVDITTIKEGISAPLDVKLSLAQRVLYMDEELAVWADVGDNWDYSNEQDFLDKIAKEDGLVNQIFPTDRSIVSIAATRKKHDYVSQCYHSVEARKKELENQRQFLLIRDGSNLHIVLSPELFHNYSKTLFPTTNEVEAPFRGVDGKSIKYSDLDYTDSVRKHDYIALSYKRLLILICGLDHNKKLFGDFYDGEPSLNFVSMEFQEKYFNFIHDVDGTGMLPSYRPPSIHTWVQGLNEEIGVGTHVLVQWRNAFSVESVPSCFERENRYNSQHGRSLEFTPDQKGKFISGKLKTASDKFYLEIPVSGSYNYGKHRKFVAKLDMNYVMSTESLFTVLCLDRLNPEDAEWYLHDRLSRNLNVSGIRMMKKAIEMAKEERAGTKELRDTLLKSIMDSKLVDSEDIGIRLIDKGIAKWKCANHKKDINILLSDNKLFFGLCDQLYQLSGNARDLTEDIKKKEEELGKKLLRVSIEADGSYVAYSDPVDQVKDNRLIDFYWSERTVYGVVRGLLKPKKSKFVLLKKFVNDETVKFEIDNISDYVPKHVPFKTPAAKNKALRMNDLTEMWSYLHDTRGNETEVLSLIEKFVITRRRLTDASKGNGVVQPTVSLPIGHIVNNEIYSRIGFSADSKNLLAWLVGDNESLRNHLINEYAKTYQRESSQRTSMRALIEELKDLDLHMVLTLTELNKKCDVSLFTDSKDDFYRLPAHNIYHYSFQEKVTLLRSKGISVYIENDDYSDLDKWLSIEKPDDFMPLVVYKDEDFGFSNKKIYAFKLNDEFFEKTHRHSRVIVHSLAAFEKQYKQYSYTQTKDDESKYITMEWEEIEPIEKHGQTSFLSYGYKLLSEKPVKSPFE